MGEQKRMAECHPDRSYFAKGLCKKCYYHEYHARNGGRMRRERYVRDRDIEHDYQLKRRYGITLEEYGEILKVQGNKCAICGKTPEENGKRLAVDHNHETGEVRGLLCNSCNMVLGQLGDMLPALWPAIQYLSGTIAFKKLDPSAIIPTRKYKYDAGLDIYSLETVYISAREQNIVRTGIALAKLSPYFTIQAWSKSGLDARLSLHVGAGIIDPNYRGEILVLLKNMSDYPIGINKGDAIAQLVIVPCMRPDIEIVSEIETTDRGDTGGINDHTSRG